MSTKIADILWCLYFPMTKTFKLFLPLAYFGLIFTRSLRLLSLYFFSLTMSPSFPCSARAESEIESGIFTNILHFNQGNGKK